MVMKLGSQYDISTVDVDVDDGLYAVRPQGLVAHIKSVSKGTGILIPYIGMERRVSCAPMEMPSAVRCVVEPVYCLIFFIHQGRSQCVRRMT